MDWWLWLLLGVASLLALWTAFVAWLAAIGRRTDARALAGFLPDCVVLVARLLRDDRVPRRRKWLLAGLVAYLALPFDLVPDVIPVVGVLDDVLVAALVLRRLARAGGDPLLRELWPGPERSLELLLSAVRA